MDDKIVSEFRELFAEMENASPQDRNKLFMKLLGSINKLKNKEGGEQ